MKRQLVLQVICFVALFCVGVFVQSTQGADPKAAQPAAGAVKADAAAGTTALALEKKVVATSPVTDGLDVKKFRKRTPMHFSKLELSKEQQDKLLEIQKAYYEVLAPLEARVARLRQERDAKLLEVLNASQKDKLNQLKSAKKPKKAAAK